MKLKNTFILSICVLLWVNSYAQFSDSLLVHFPLDGHAIDFSGNDNHGILYGGTPVNDYFGNPNSAIYFDGVDDYIDVGDIIDIDEQIGITISAWFKPDTILSQTNRYAGISFGKKEMGRLEMRFSREDSLNFSSALTSGESFSWNGNGTNTWSENVNYNQWYHVVSTYQDTLITTYVNGTKSINKVTKANNGGWFYYVPDNVSLRLAKAFNTNNQERYYRGVIDEVYIHYKVLDSIAVRLMYERMIAANDEEFIENKIQFGPNPSNGELHINSHDGQIESIAIYTMNGEVVKTLDIQAKYKKLDFKELENGIYFVKIMLEDEIVTKKLSIHH